MTSDRLFVGADLGTSSLKCGLFDLGGQRIAAAKVAYPTHQCGDAAEQNADDWWAALKRGIGQLLPGVEPSRVAALSVGGHAPSPVFVDRALKPVAPVMTWLDRRSAPQRDQLASRLGRFPETGPERLLCQVAARLMCLRDNSAEQFQKIDCVLHSGDYLVARLTGKKLNTSPTVADVLAAADLPPRIFTALHLPAGEIVAEIVADVAAELGLEPHTLIIAAGLDSFLASIGSGVSQPGDACLSIGSSAGVSLLTDSGCVGRFEWCGHQMLSRPLPWGGRLFEWLPAAAATFDLAHLLVAAARLAPPSSSQLSFKELVDEHSCDDQKIRQLIASAAREHEPPVIVRLVLDAIFLCQRRVLDDFEIQAGPVRRTVTVGALSAYPEVSQLQADILGRKLDLPEYTESGTLGAAILAAIAIEHCGAPTALARMARIERSVTPRKGVAAHYRQLISGNDAERDFTS